MSFFEELKRRNVFRVGVAYAIAAWVLLQVADLVLENIHAPDWVIQTLMLVVGLGFIVALVIAWAYEMTPEGLKKEKDVDRSQSIVGATGKKLDRIVMGFLVVAVAVLLYRQSGNTPAEQNSIQEPPQLEQDTANTATPTILQKSVAVLPFVNISSDPEQEYFSDGLSEELLNRLAQNDQLHVAARTSAFQFKGQNLDIADIGRQLKVAHVLEGSVRKAGNRLRITAQLIQVDNGYHLWSETYEREIDDVFVIQDDISLAISKALETELGATRKASRPERPTENLEAYNFYLQARFFLAKRGADNMLKANDLFDQAVALDPQFTAAWSGKAFNNAVMFSYIFGRNIQESLQETIKAANKALELDPNNAEAYNAIGRGYADARNWNESRKNFERAFELEPNNVGVLNLYSDFLINIGDIDRAIQLRQQAVDLDPLSAIHASDLAHKMMAAGRIPEALVSAKRSASLAPDSIYRIAPLVSALQMSNEYEEADAVIKQVEAAFSNDPTMPVFVKSWQTIGYLRQGDTENLRKMVDKATEAVASDPDARPIYPTVVALAVVALDGGDAAVVWLERAYQDNDIFLLWPNYFYLPELISRESRWLEFWKKPGLKELLDIRRANPYPATGLWDIPYLTGQDSSDRKS